MEYNLNEEDDDFEELKSFEDMIKAQSLYHADQIINSTLDEVDNFIKGSTSLVLDKIDEVQDERLLIELTQLIGTLMGGMGKAIVELKKTNTQLKTDFITDQIKKQNPDLN